MRLLVATAVVGLVLVNVAQARRDRERRQSSNPPAAKAAAVPTTLTKSMAIDAVIGGLMINGSPAAEKTLEQIVTGEIPFGGHSKQAAQGALLALAFQPTPAGEAFLLRLFTDPDNAIRVGDAAAYPPADLRADASHILAKIASPKLRLELAKLYTQPSTPPAARSAIEEVLRAPSNANFKAQVEVFRSPDVADALKAELQKILIEKNAAAVKSALRLEGDGNAKGEANAALPFSPAGGGAAGTQNQAELLQNLGKMMGAMPRLPGGAAAGNPRAAAAKGAKPPSNAAAATGVPALKGLGKPGSPGAAATPALMMLEMKGQMLNLAPVDPGTVAQELWKPDFIESLVKTLSGGKSDESLVVSGLASLPIKAAREKLKEYLHKERNKGPEEFGKAEMAKKTTSEPTQPPAAANIRRRAGRRRKDDEGGLNGGGEQSARKTAPRFGMGMGMGGGASAFGQSPTKKEITEFGTNWYDPGTLIVLKTVVNYAERPPEKPHHRSMYPTSPQRMTPYMEKRMREKAEKQQVLESTYEWRDAIEKSVRQWNERLAAVAEAPAEPAGAGDKSAAAEDKPAADAAQTSSSKGDTTAKAVRSSSSSKTPALGPVPTPAVAMPFALHAGGTIAKEYHLRWPQDLPPSFALVSSEPLAVDYVRLEGQGEFGKALTHYRSAISAAAGSKPKIFLRQIENGKWLDAIQKDATGHKTRSIDVVVTREAGDDDKEKKSKDEQVTVEILLVEIETPGSEVTPGSSKKEARETTSTTSP